MSIHALSLNILKPSYGDASNGGISHHYDDIYVVCANGPYEFEEDSLPTNLMSLVIADVPGVPYIKLVPYASHAGASIGPMFGGCYAASSDHRWQVLLEKTLGFSAVHGVAVPIHDRFETPAQYDALSR